MSVPHSLDLVVSSGTSVAIIHSLHRGKTELALGAKIETTNVGPHVRRRTEHSIVKLRSAGVVPSGLVLGNSGLVFSEKPRVLPLRED